MEFKPWGVIYAVIGLVLSVFMSFRMTDSFIWRGISVIGTTVACYVIGHGASQ